MTMGEPKKTPILELRGVGKWYEDFCARWDINLSVMPGERVVVCGPSGSGKSTMIRCVNRLEVHQAGQIIVNNVELTEDMKNIELVRREVGMVFQHFNLFPHLTVIENLTLGPIRNLNLSKQESMDRGMEFLDRVHIAEQAHKYPSHLSGGQQQRVAIARALCMKPKLMLFDEPSLGLAPHLVETTFEIIAEIRAQGVTVLMVEQNAYAALELCDRSYLLESGAVTLTGTGAELLGDPHVKEAYLGG